MTAGSAIEFIANTVLVRFRLIGLAMSAAEHDTAVLAAAGYSNKAIADELVLSVRSVENRLQRVYEKLGICSRAALPTALNLVPSGRGAPHPRALTSSTAIRCWMSTRTR
jgi:DNA-binding CsgD family transcriptional regulator